MLNNISNDLKVYIPAIEENIEANRDIITGGAVAKIIDWTEEAPKELNQTADTVLVCDCIYYEASLLPLIRHTTSLGRPSQNKSQTNNRISDFFIVIILEPKPSWCFSDFACLTGRVEGQSAIF